MELADKLRSAIDAAEFSATAPQNVILWYPDAKALQAQLIELETNNQQLHREIERLCGIIFTSPPDTPDLEAIEARVNAATKGEGEWTASGNGVHIGTRCVATTHAYDDDQRHADAVFIVHAFFDIPALIAEVRQLRKQ